MCVCQFPWQSCSHLLLQHVLPLLPHLPHQQRQVWDAVPRLQLLQCRIQQAEGASSAYARAEGISWKYENAVTQTADYELKEPSNNTIMLK